MWQVNTQGYVGDPYLIGMVAHGEGFNDSPDAESISGGVCMKNAEAIALGRQGNYFMWGFSGSPAYMTEEANLVFVNTICYIKKFDHNKAIVKKVQVETRELIDELIYRIDRSVYDKAITSRREGNLRLKRMQDSLRAEPVQQWAYGELREAVGEGECREQGTDLRTGEMQLGADRTVRNGERAAVEKVNDTSEQEQGKHDPSRLAPGLLHTRACSGSAARWIA